MAQTTDGLSFKDVKIELATGSGCSSYNDISGFANSIEVGGGDRQSGEKYTFDGDTAIIRVGKREPLEITVSAVYTEGASDPVETIRAAYEGGTVACLRWSPKGGSVGDFVYTSDEGYIINPVYPGGEAGSGDPVAVEFTLKVAKVTKSVQT